MKKNIRLYSGIDMYDWQKETHDYITDTLQKGKECPMRNIIIKASRQIYGKSCFTKAELLRFSLGFKDRQNAYIAPASKLSKKMYKEIAKSADGLIRYKNSTDLFIEFKTGSAISFFSAEQRDNLRGFTVTGLLVVDEASFISNDVYNELISPWTRVHNAFTIFASTPKYKNGFFYDRFNLGLSENSQIYKTFDWSGNYPPNEEDEFLRENKKIIPRLNYMSEYLGQFIDAEGTVFGNFKHVLYDPEELPGIAEGDELFIGIDWGTGNGGDYTSISAFNQRGEQIELEYWNNMTPQAQINKIAEIIIELKIVYKAVIKKVLAEKNSIGDVYVKQVQDKLNKYGIFITPFWTDENSKRLLVETFQVGIEQNQMKLFREAEQETQLSNFAAILNKSTNKLKYEAQNGKHDDIVVSDMLAWLAYINRSSNWGGISIIGN